MLVETYRLVCHKKLAGARTTVCILGGNHVTVKFSEVLYTNPLGRHFAKTNEPYRDKK
jgi:hypothetical protein